MASAMATAVSMLGEIMVRLFSNPHIKKAAPNIYSIHYQRAALRGVEHFVREEQGLLVTTTEHDSMKLWVETLPASEEKDKWEVDLKDPTKVFMKNKEGDLFRKYYEYNLQEDGSFADTTDPMNPLKAPASFNPQRKSNYQFYVGGVPVFERNFEETGMADSVYVPLMFLVLMVALYAMYRSVVGVLILGLRQCCTGGDGL